MFMFPKINSARLFSVSSYIVCLGIVDRLSCYFSAVRSSIDEEPQVADFLQHAMGLLTAITRLATKRWEQYAALMVNYGISNTIVLEIT